jgi:uncharacterized protein (DUF305 family)
MINTHPSRFFAVALMSLTLGCAPKHDQESTTDSMHTSSNAMAHDTSHTMSMQPDMQHNMSMMNTMMVDSLGGADSNYELRFIDMMIPHHEGAVMMAKNAEKNASRPELKKLAAQIIASQQKEIDQMKQWRKAWYGK